MKKTSRLGGSPFAVPVALGTRNHIRFRLACKLLFWWRMKRQRRSVLAWMLSCAVAVSLVAAGTARAEKQTGAMSQRAEWLHLSPRLQAAVQAKEQDVAHMRGAGLPSLFLGPVNTLTGQKKGRNHES